MRFASLLLVAGVLAACGSESGDPHSAGGVPPIGGKDKRISQVRNPEIEGHAELVATTQAVSGAIVIAVDSFDETQNGKGTGTIYVQDLGSTEPYSGISLFAPSFIPGNLSVAPGDVLDLRGRYTESATIGPTVTFPPGSVLPQISQPIATFRYETQVPQPTDIDVKDLADYAKGGRWIGMLVRVKNLTLQKDAINGMTGRISVDLTPPDPDAEFGCNVPFPKPGRLVNDLFDLQALGLKQGDTVKEIVGVVGFFCTLNLAPRSIADITR